MILDTSVDDRWDSADSVAHRQRWYCRNATESDLSCRRTPDKAVYHHEARSARYCLGHVVENYAALKLTLTQEDLGELDRAFPPPTQKVPLEVI